MFDQPMNRVLGRMGARTLTQEELKVLGGNFGTQLPCTFEPPNFHDGECSAV
jgi:hypothetical protein